MPLPTSHKAAVCKNTQTISVEERPIPKPIGSEVLLRIEASGICATDLHLVRRSVPYLNRTVEVCGHEGIARIVGLGPDVDTEWKIGDRVAHKWLYNICKQCEMCRTGYEQLCTQRQLSGKDVEGCWAEYTVADSDYLLRIPEALPSSDAAPILCAGEVDANDDNDTRLTIWNLHRNHSVSGIESCQLILRAMGRRGRRSRGPGPSVGIMNCTFSNQLTSSGAVQYAKAQGLRVLGLDGGKEKEKSCAQLGVDAYVDFTQCSDLPKEVTRVTQGGPHGVLVMSSSPRAYEQALSYIRKTGVMVCIGITPTKMQFPIGPEYFVAKAVRLTGVSTGTMEDTREALELVSSKKVKPIVFEKRLEDIQDCVDLLEKGDVVGRFVVVF